ncbi:MAG: hypothetical protein IPJ65_04355 [Archangiaceae bacterium]|nr:hypothetical protein [Archangiaceae bacterium]
MRVLIALLLAVHGVIHLIGFLVPFGLLRSNQFSGRTLLQLPGVLQYGVAALWLAVCLALVVAAGLELSGRPMWWGWAAVALVVSQLLIVLQWPDAKAGTVANVLLALAVIVAAATSRFDARVKAETRALAVVSPEPSTALAAGAVAALPQPVRRWLEASGAAGRPPVQTVRLEQRGQMWLTKGSAPMEVEAEQLFNVERPGFVWKVSTRWAHLVPIVGRDRYADGHGEMLILGGALVPFVDARGEHIDQGTLLRFLAEMVWFPSAAVSPYVSWEPVDELHARATMTWQGVTGSAEFRFDSEGRCTGLIARRYLGSSSAHLEPWQITVTAWHTFDGVEVPSEGDVTWKLADGDFTYFHWRVTSLEYGPARHAAALARPLSGRAPAPQPVHRDAPSAP